MITRVSAREAVPVRRRAVARRLGRSGGISSSRSSPRSGEEDAAVDGSQVRRANGHGATSKIVLRVTKRVPC